MAGAAWLIIEGAAVGAAAIAAWVRQRKRRQEEQRVLTRGQLVPIASAAEGQLQRVIGRLELASGAEPLVAPVSKRPCAYYELTVAEWEKAEVTSIYSSGRPGGWATRIYDSRALAGFELVDDSGRAYVELNNASVALDMDLSAEPKTLAAAPDDLALVLAEISAAKGVVLGDYSRIAVHEGVLEPGEQVSAYGLCHWRTAADEMSYRDVQRTLVVGPPPGSRTIITDKLGV